mgnify:CR=1
MIEIKNYEAYEKLTMKDVENIVGKEEFERLKGVAQFYKHDIHAGFMSILYFNDFPTITDKGDFPLSEEELEDIARAIQGAVGDATINVDTIKAVILNSLGDINWDEDSDHFDDYSEWQWWHLSDNDIIKIIACYSDRYK